MHWWLLAHVSATACPPSATSPPVLLLCPCACSSFAHRMAQHDKTFSFLPSMEGLGGFYDTIKGWGLGMCQGLPKSFIMKYTPATQEVHVVADGFWYGNGVALSADEDFLAISETDRLRVVKLWLKGPKVGRRGGGWWGPKRGREGRAWGCRTRHGTACWCSRHVVLWGGVGCDGCSWQGLMQVTGTDALLHGVVHCLQASPLPSSATPVAYCTQCMPFTRLCCQALWWGGMATAPAAVGTPAASLTALCCTLLKRNPPCSLVCRLLPPGGSAGGDD